MQKILDENTKNITVPKNHSKFIRRKLQLTSQKMLYLRTDLIFVQVVTGKKKTCFLDSKYLNKNTINHINVQTIFVVNILLRNCPIWSANFYSLLLLLIKKIINSIQLMFSLNNVDILLQLFPENINVITKRIIQTYKVKKMLSFKRHYSSDLIIHIMWLCLLRNFRVISNLLFVRAEILLILI